jgi:hypothetical protein
VIKINNIKRFRNISITNNFFEYTKITKKLKVNFRIIFYKINTQYFDISHVYIVTCHATVDAVRIVNCFINNLQAVTTLITMLHIYNYYTPIFSICHIPHHTLPIKPSIHTISLHRQTSLLLVSIHLED